MIAIDGATGEVFVGDVPVVDSPVMTYIADGIEAAHEAAGDDQEVRELVDAVHRLLSHADDVRRLRVRANADNGEDAARARKHGAEGIGLCRTEHQFLGDRRVQIERVVLSETGDERDQALEALLPLQRQDFTELLEAMDGLPATIRLIDPPLHEFLPDLPDLAVKVAVAEERGETDPHDVKLLAAVRRMHESNPMLGLRGVRLGLRMPGLFSLQIRAIAEACVELRKQGKDPQPEIMVPLVGSQRELQLVARRGGGDPEGDLRGDRRGAGLRDRLHDRAAAGRAHLGPDRGGGRLLLLRHQRPDADHVGVLARRRRGRVLRDVPGERRAHDLPVRDARRRRRRPAGQDAGVEGGRSTKPDLKMGVCGEHGGDPESIHFFHDAGSGLRVLLAVPGAGGAAGGRPGDGGAQGRRVAAGAPDLHP